MDKQKSKIMQDGFEKEIQRRMQDFNLEPSPQVWNEIDAALSEKKRRRFIIWWWLLPLMLAGGSIIWLYHINYKTSAPSVENYQKEKARETKNQTIQKENAAKKKEEGKDAKQDGITNSNQPGAPGSNNSEAAGTVTNKNYENKIDQTNLEATRIVEQPEVGKRIIQQNNTGISFAGKDIDSSKKELALSFERNDSAFQFPFKDSAGKIAQKTKKEVSIKKRSNWLITVGAGITSTKEHGSSSLLDPDKSFDRQTGAVNSPGNYSSSPDSTYKIIKPENGFHFTVGVVHQYPLSNKWIISSGLQYRFLTNKQKVGKYVDSLTASYSSVNLIFGLSCFFFLIIFY